MNYRIDDSSKVMDLTPLASPVGGQLFVAEMAFKEHEIETSGL
jgi:hypothetical protein